MTFDLWRRRAGARRPRYWTRSRWAILVVVALVTGFFGAWELSVRVAETVTVQVQSCETRTIASGRGPDQDYDVCSVTAVDGGSPQVTTPVLVQHPTGALVDVRRPWYGGLQDPGLDRGQGWQVLPAAFVLLAATWWMGMPQRVARPGRHAPCVPAVAPGAPSPRARHRRG